MIDMDIVDIAEPRNHSHQHSQSQPQPRKQSPVKTGTWLADENARLRKAVTKYGTQWVRVATEVGTRNGDQCAKRWNENLNPHLDHGPWTPEEDERLLTMVKTYGRNWKFMADGFLELRAPLALKNRYSLLMRRLNRPETGQKQAAMNGSAKPSRHAALSHHSSGSTSPLPNSAVDLTSFFSDGMGPQSHQSEYAAMGAAGSDFLLSTGAFSASMMTPSDATTTGGQRGGGEGGGTALWKTTATSAADDQAFIWQQHPVLGSGIEPGSVSSSTGTNEGENRVEEMTTMSENGMSSRREFGPRSAALSDAPAAEVEYLVTCQWGKLKTLMNHLVDAAISESAGWAAEDDQVTVTLRLRAR